MKATSKNIYRIPDSDANLIKVRELYGSTHHIVAIKGTTVDMTLLNKEQSVCWGDGENYYFLMTNRCSNFTLKEQIFIH